MHRSDSQTTKTLFRILVPALLFAVVLAQDAEAANLVANGDFTAVDYSGTKALTTIYGQFGTGTGSTLTLRNWTTTGYNFLYAPNTADAGTTAGAATGQPNEAPGQYTAANGYGNTYLWGSKNGGKTVLPATDPAGGNFIAGDGAYEVGAISQTINGLTVGNAYVLNFYWAAGQQESFMNATTENWQVSLGAQTFTTPTYNLASQSFSGWMQQSFTYTATAASETLSFLANGTPTGQPPFSLLGGVSLNAVPEPSAWMIFVGLGAVCTAAGIVRRRRRRLAGCTGEMD